MKTILVHLILIMLFSSASAVAADTAEEPKTCNQCSMNRASYAQSRMLIVYADGTTTGACSLNCVAAELHNNSSKEVVSILVADYTTKELIDAKTAVWVVGGKKKGVMTVLAKWAFARQEEARLFIAENGGTVSSFEQAMNLATMEIQDQIAEQKAVEKEILRELK